MSKRNIIHRIILFILLTVGVSPLVYFASVQIGSASQSSTDNSELKAEEDFDRVVLNNAFGVGEKLTFDVNYGFINAGYATMEVAGLIEYENRPCYRIVSTANSNSFFSSFYKVEDKMESIVDAVGIFSWRFEKQLREGSYSADRMYTINQREHYAVYKEDTIDVANFVQDALSLLYYTRTQELEVGKTLFVDNFIDGKKYQTEVKVLKKETIDVDAGTFACLVVEPLLQSAGVFKHEGSLKVWLTDDRLKMPVLMKSKVLVGSISAELTDYKLGELIEF